MNENHIKCVILGSDIPVSSFMIFEVYFLVRDLLKVVEVLSYRNTCVHEEEKQIFNSFLPFSMTSVSNVSVKPKFMGLFAGSTCVFPGRSLCLLHLIKSKYVLWEQQVLNCLLDICTIFHQQFIDSINFMQYGYDQVEKSIQTEPKFEGNFF